MQRHSLRREEGFFHVIAAIIVAAVVLIAVLYVAFIYLPSLEEAVCEEGIINDWFEFLDFLDPDKVSIKPLSGDPGVAGYIGFEQLILGAGKWITAYSYYWEARLVVSIAINIACSVAQHRTETYVEDIQDDILEYVLGTILEIEFSDGSEYVFVPVKVKISNPTGVPVFETALVRDLSEKSNLEDFPSTFENFDRGIEVPIHR